MFETAEVLTEGLENDEQKIYVRIGRSPSDNGSQMTNTADNSHARHTWEGLVELRARGPMTVSAINF
jgi:hypothetical protein